MGLESVNFSIKRNDHLIECCGVIVLMRRMKREVRFVVGNIAKIGLSAFVCCFGGILLWVNGTNLWHIMNSFHLPKYSVSVTGVFLLWLLTYGFCGIVLALILIQSRNCPNSTAALAAFSLGCGVYLLMLVWYAIFFCTHLTMFAVLILLAAFLLTAALFFIVRRGLMVLKLLLFLIAIVEIYFIYFNLTFYLVN